MTLTLINNDLATRSLGTNDKTVWPCQVIHSWKPRPTDRGCLEISAGQNGWQLRDVSMSDEEKGSVRRSGLLERMSLFYFVSLVNLTFEDLRRAHCKVDRC